MTVVFLYHGIYLMNWEVMQCLKLGQSVWLMSITTVNSGIVLYWVVVLLVFCIFTSQICILYLFELQRQCSFIFLELYKEERYSVRLLVLFIIFIEMSEQHLNFWLSIISVFFFFFC